MKKYKRNSGVNMDDEQLRIIKEITGCLRLILIGSGIATLILIGLWVVVENL